MTTARRRGCGDGMNPQLIGDAPQSFNVDIVFAGLIIFAGLSLIMTGLVRLLEERTSRWRPQRAANE